MITDIFLWIWLKTISIEDILGGNMKKIIKILLLSVVLLASILCLTACKGGENVTPPPQTEYYSVVYSQDMAEDKTISVEVGKTPASTDIPEIVYKKGYTAVWEEKNFASAKNGEKIIVCAVYTAKTYTVSYDVDGGKPITDKTTVRYGQPYALLIAEKDNFILSGYVFVDGDKVVTLPVQGASWEIDNDVTVKALYTSISYEVTYDTDGGNAIPSGAFAFDQMIESLPTPVKTGYLFLGWKLSESGVPTGNYILSGQRWQHQQSVTLIACWQELAPLANFTYTFRADGKADVVVEVEQGQTITYNDIPEIEQNVVGYIGSWACNGEIIDFSSPATESKIITIKYTPKQYCIKFDTQGGNPIADMYVTYDQQNIILPTPVKTGCVFNDSWYFGDDNLSVNISKWNIDQEEDIVLTVQWYVTVTFVQTGFNDKVYKVKVGESFTQTLPKCETSPSGLYAWNVTGVDFTNLQQNIVINAFKLEIDLDWTENV